MKLRAHLVGEHSLSTEEAEKLAPTKNNYNPKKHIPCTEDECPNRYSQTVGLKYHLVTKHNFSDLEAKQRILEKVDPAILESEKIVPKARTSIGKRVRVAESSGSDDDDQGSVDEKLHNRGSKRQSLTRPSRRSGGFERMDSAPYDVHPDDYPNISQLMDASYTAVNSYHNTPHLVAPTRPSGHASASGHPQERLERLEDKVAELEGILKKQEIDIAVLKAQKEGNASSVEMNMTLIQLVKDLTAQNQELIRKFA